MIKIEKSTSPRNSYFCDFQPPRFSFYAAAKPIYTSRRNLPPSKIDNSKVGIKRIILILGVFYERFTLRNIKAVSLAEM